MKEYRLLIAALILLAVVYAKEYTWAHLGSTGFWIIGFALMIYCFILSLWALIELVKWIKKANDHVSIWTILISIGLILISIYGMK